jgi:hypothetical protein
MIQVKGSAPASSIRFITERFGSDAVRRVAAELPAEERAAVEAGLLASTWYPFSLLLNLSRAIEKHFGRDVPRIQHEMGRASADYALTIVYKLFFRIASPQFILSRAASLFRNYYTTGELRVVVAETGHAVLELGGFEEPPREMCPRLGGFYERTIELAGGKGFRMVHEQCMNRGDAVCRTEAWWQ